MSNKSSNFCKKKRAFLSFFVALHEIINLLIRHNVKTPPPDLHLYVQQRAECTASLHPVKYTPFHEFLDNMFTIWTGIRATLNHGEKKCSNADT